LPALGVAVEKAECFCEALFQARVEIIKKKQPKATDYRFAYVRQLPQRFPIFSSGSRISAAWIKMFRARIVYGRRLPQGPM